MRWLEVRRHSLTKKGAARGRGSHLSGPGVTLARVVGAGLGPVAYVVTSASGHCEGARLGFDRGRWVSIEFRRAPGPDPPRRCGDAPDSPC